jgi:hypothetical protein
MDEYDEYESKYVRKNVGAAHYYKRMFSVLPIVQKQQK